MSSWFPPPPRLWEGRSPTAWLEAISEQAAPLRTYQRQCYWLGEQWVQSLKLHLFRSWGDCLAEIIQVNTASETNSQSLRPSASGLCHRSKSGGLSPEVAGLKSEPSQPGSLLGSKPPSRYPTWKPMLELDSRPRASFQSFDQLLRSEFPPLPLPLQQITRSADQETPSASETITQANQGFWAAATSPRSRRSPVRILGLPTRADQQLLSQLVKEPSWESTLPDRQSMQTIGQRTSASSTAPLPNNPASLSHERWKFLAQRVVQRLRLQASQSLEPSLSVPGSQALSISIQSLVAQSARPVTGPMAPLTLLLAQLQLQATQAERKRVEDCSPVSTHTSERVRNQIPSSGYPAANRSFRTFSPPTASPSGSLSIEGQPMANTSHLDQVSSESPEATPPTLLPLSAPESAPSASSPSQFFAALQDISIPRDLRTPITEADSLPPLRTLLARSSGTPAPLGSATAIIRRAVKTGEPPNSETELQQLAAQIKQILDEEARRQGIDV